MSPSRSEVLARSQALASPKFAGLADRWLESDEQLIDATDAFGMEVVLGKDYAGPLAIVLTDRRLVVFRGQGMLGAKAPLVCTLDGLDQVGPTVQNNVKVEWHELPSRRPMLWTLRIDRTAETAERWAQQIARAAWPPDESDAHEGDTSDEVLALLHDFADRLRPGAGPDALGEPFGPGAGLEAVVELATSTFPSPAALRAAGSMMMVDLLVNTREGVRDRMLELMGCGHGLKAVDDIGGAAVALLAEFDTPGQSMWDLWNRRDDVAAEMLAWHTVARLRLATDGRMEPVTRPPAAMRD